ncbi:ABC transporter ATP-binding protein/permease [Mumia sp. zg.B21]|uniref:ABC transporter ATP-binding protein n=1 Tax=Mumia sp. zg.B21 TaxID=2855447 RepID=UPI001C6F55A0|nr:ABC transporter ATP-binding protein [Mumia sp. zg.B21]MBW9210367.1 ABC transporter ATP-binding protein/permease [Mumia sp. zg.B21]
MTSPRRGGAATRHLLPVADRADTARLAWSLLRRRRLPLTAAAAGFALAGLLGLAAPWVLGDLVDVIRNGGEVTDVVRAAVVVAGAAVLGGAASGLAIIGLGHAAVPALARLREDVVARALELDPEHVEEAGAGDLLARVNDDVRSVTQSLDEALPITIESAVAIGFTTVGLAALDWRLGLAGLCAMPFYVMGLRWYLPRSAPRYAEERVAQSERAEALLSGLHGSRTLREIGYERAWAGHVADRSQRAMSVSIGVFGMLTRFFGRTNRAELVGLLLVLGTSFVLVRSGQVTVGAATTAALFFHRLFNPIGGLLLTFDQVQAAGASLARLAGLARLAPAPTADVAPSTTLPGLRLEAIRHRYPDGDDVLHDVDLRVEPGERVALVGATGAGKSTLALIAAGHLAPTSGSRALGGTAYEELGSDGVRARAALVTQQVHVFAGTLRDNLSLAAPDADDDRLRDALTRTGDSGWVDALEDGLDTAVGGDGHALTPSQAQQVALARVVLADRPVVVLDEATAEAGSSGARLLDRAADVALAGRTALVVAHRLSQAAAADRIVVLDRGKVAEEGTHAELLAREGTYAALWASWSQS